MKNKDFLFMQEMSLEEEMDLPEDKKSPIAARTDSNKVEPDPKVIAKNKKFFINCFGCKIYYE